MLDDNGEPGLSESDSDWSDNSDADAGKSTPLSGFSPVANYTHGTVSLLVFIRRSNGT
jgi:hypothetical protein